MPPSRDNARASDLVHAVLALSDRMRRHFAARAEELDLTPPQAHLLRELASGPRPMGELAGQLACDASNVTGLTDRLERRGLVERRPAPGDRRVKVLALTDDGERLQRALEQRLLTEPPVTAGLSAGEQDRLLSLLQRVVSSAGD